MKIAVTYTDKELEEATRVLELLQKRYPRARTHKKPANPPYIHACFTVKLK